MERPVVHNTYGALFIGVLLAGILYGVSCSQVFYYFRYYSKRDDRYTKAVVIITLLSDTIHQGLISHTVYTHIVTNFFFPHRVNEIVWSMVVEVLFNGITALLVQTFYAVRIWKFSGGNIPVAVTLAAFIIGEFVFILIFFIKGIHLLTFEKLHTIKAVSMSINILAAIGDVLITAVFCFFLHKARTTIRRSNRMITMLISFSIQTGALTSLCAVASLAAINIWPNAFIYVAPYFVLGRLYCNSLLATLNVREAIHKKGRGNNGISLGPTGGSTTDNQKETDFKSGYIVNGESHRYPGDIKSRGTAKDIEVIGCTKEVEIHVHTDSAPFVRPDDQVV